MIERTLSIIKPDAVGKNKIGEILSRFESSGLRIVAARMLHMTREEAGRFYAVHQDKGFFGSLTTFMSSGRILVSVLEGEDAISRARGIMGETDSTKAAPGTIRGDFGTDVEKNAVHGSDGTDTASWEISFFFGQLEIEEQ